jgi:hypothetical protein
LSFSANGDFTRSDLFIRCIWDYSTTIGHGFWSSTAIDIHGFDITLLSTDMALWQHFTGEYGHNTYLSISQHATAEAGMPIARTLFIITISR